MIKRICKHCEQELEFKNHQQFGAHVANCKSNPNYAKRCEKISKSHIKRKLYNLICSKCSKKFKRSLTEYKYNKSEKFYCSRSCSNSRKHSIETKRKISLSQGGDGLAYCEKPINKRTTEYYKQNGHERKRILWWEQECKCNHCNYNLYDPINGPYELHHIDGDHSNQQRWNEELLCCNCHRMTDTWGFKGRKHSKESRQKIKENMQK